MTNMIRKSEVFTASVGSFSFVMFGTMLLVIGTILAKVHGSELINLLLGKEASISLRQFSHDSILPAVDTLLANNLLGRSTVFSVWMFIGLIVFTIISGIQRAVADIHEIESEMGLKNVNKPILLNTVIHDVAFRVGIALLWVGFTLLCLQFLLPFFVAAIFILFGAVAGMQDMLIALLAVVVVFLALHAHVIFARLFVGRIRLFGL